MYLCPKCGAKVQIRKTKKKKTIIYVKTIQAHADYISWNKPKPGEIIGR